MNDVKTPRRMGLIKNPDGTLTMSICRARPGHEGEGNCHHFVHGTSAQMKAMIAEYTLKKDAGMLSGVNYRRDMQSVKLALREYLISTGHSPKKLKENGSIEDDWFDGNHEEYVKALKLAADEGPLKDLKTNEEVVEDIKSLNDKGIKVVVTTDRMVGLRDDDDSEIWSDLNGVSMESLDGEAPVVIMSGNGVSENEAAEDVRDDATIRIDSLDSDKSEDLKNLGYISMS